MPQAFTVYQPGQMTADKKREFITNLTGSVAALIQAHITAGRVPEDWDGHELRCLLAEVFGHEARWTTIKKQPRSRRARDYRSAVLERSLDR